MCSAWLCKNEVPARTSMQHKFCLMSSHVLAGGFATSLSHSVVVSADVTRRLLSELVVQVFASRIEGHNVLLHLNQSLALLLRATCVPKSLDL